MNGAESLIRTAVAAGIDLCLTNPGTTELPLVNALDAVPGIRAVLGLFEGVCTGAADGYGRMADRPALTLLHLGPGFGNGIANLHNARRARSPIVNLIGDHATWHRAADAPLTSDIESLANPVSGWVRANRSARDLADDFADAVAAASDVPHQVASLIVPADCQWGAAVAPARPRPVLGPRPVTAAVVERISAVLRRDAPTMLFLGGRGLRTPALHAAARIAAATGCRLARETFPARLERGAGLPAVEPLPYFPEQALAALSGATTVVLAGAPEPVSFFGYEGVRSRLIPEGCAVEVLACPDEDVTAALEAVAEAIGAVAPGRMAPAERPPLPSGPLDPASAGAVIAALQPEGLIVMDEAATSAWSYFTVSAGAPRHTYLALTGGAIGLGLPSATGAALACPDRRVLAFQADGSGMYTVQALWTQAREGLNVTTVVCANRRYRILQIELKRAGVAELSPRVRALTDLSHPTIDWVHLATGLGVPAVRVETADAFAAALAPAFREPGPRLIEIVL